MLGRRKSRSTPNTIDITDRVRRRLLDAEHAAPVAANAHNRLDRRRPNGARQTRADGAPAKLLRFNDTPVYHVRDSGAVTPAELYQVLAVLADRLEAELDVPAVSRRQLARQVSDMLGEILGELQLRLNLQEQRDLVRRLLDEMVGFGPLEVLLSDDTVTEIMVNGPDEVFVERRGKVQPTDVAFRNETHLLRVARRMAKRIGRRIGERQPLANGRLPDGSRINVTVPPIAVDGPKITVRKHSRSVISLDHMIKQENLSRDMATVLRVAARCKLNVVISGGTGCGKTTLLNAMSEMIDRNERVVTIEDAADLHLVPPHVVRLETQPFNPDGQEELTERELLRNALNMRPDRIIIGEVRGAEVIEMLQTMNCGHDGSLSTVHANGTRDALTRLANLALLAGLDVPLEGIQAQLAHAIDLVVHVDRLRDGRRRVTEITEVLGYAEGTITTQDLFTFEQTGEDDSGRILGRFKSLGVKPHFAGRAGRYDLDGVLASLV